MPLLDSKGKAADDAPLSRRSPLSDRTPRRRLETIALGALLALTTATLAEANAEVDAHTYEHEVTPREPDARRHTRWQTHAVTLVLDPSLGALAPIVEAGVRNALARWQETGAPVPYVHLELGSTASPASLEPDGKNTILLAPIEFQGHETDLAVTVGFSDPSTGELSEADIVLNTKHVFAELPEAEDGALERSCNGEALSDSCDQRYDVENVLAHEFGHFYGLGEDYDHPGTTMYSCTSACEVHKRDLEPIDVDRILDLYADPIDVTAGCSPASFGASRRLPLASSASFGLGLAFLAALRRFKSARTRGH